MIRSWLINSCSKEAANYVLYIKTVTELWKKLHDHYSQGNRPRIYELKKRFAGLTQGSMDVTTYYMYLKVFLDELTQYQPPLDPTNPLMKPWYDHKQEESVLQFLIGLNDSFSHVRGQILLRGPLSPVSKVFSLIIQEERQYSIGQVVFPLEEFSTESIVNAIVSGSGNRRGNGRSVFQCTYCGLKGYTKERCYKLIGYPSKDPSNRDSKPKTRCNSRNLLSMFIQNLDLVLRIFQLFNANS